VELIDQRFDKFNALLGLFEKLAHICWLFEPSHNHWRQASSQIRSSHVIDTGVVSNALEKNTKHSIIIIINIRIIRIIINIKSRSAIDNVHAGGVRWCISVPQAFENHTVAGR
jgi:hypothetical protein